METTWTWSYPWQNSGMTWSTSLRRSSKHSYFPLSYEVDYIYIYSIYTEQVNIICVYYM